MNGDASYPSEDGDLAVLAEVVAGIETFSEANRHAQIGEIRMLAAAGHLAEKQARGASERVKAHDMALRSIAAEIGGVLRVTDRTVQTRIGSARELVDLYPATLTAWEEGLITRGHVYKIVDAGGILPVEVRPEFETEAIELCRADTPNRVESDLKLLADRLHPRSFTERHEAAATKRCVRVFPLPDGMAEMQAVLPQALADGIYDRLTQSATAIIDARPKAGDAGKDAAGEAGAARAGSTVPLGAGSTDASTATGFGANGDASAGADAAGHDFTGDTRTIDQIRADVLTDTLLTGAPTVDPTAATGAPTHGAGHGGLGAIRATVQIVVPVTTLLGKDDNAVELVGSSPIDPATARTLAGCAPSLQRILTHPIHGTVLEVDQYQPTTAMRRLLKGRDKHCRFPGCRMPAVRCELDHTTDHALGGVTACCNLACLCQRHHSMKQFTPWKVRQLTGGVLEWTSPLGRTYREDAPKPLVFFTPAVPPQPTPTGRGPGHETDPGHSHGPADSDPADSTPPPF